MANVFTSSRSKVVGSFDTVGASPAITVTGSKLVDLSLNIARGSWQGAVNLERKTNTGEDGEEEWVKVSGYTHSSDPLEVTFRSATTREYRLNVVTQTAGTLYVELAAGNKDN